MKQEAHKYFAFISYSHKDEKWGKWLHRSLESYKIPGKLRRERKDLPKKIFPVFRDREELPVSSELSENINYALTNSKYLIVICSPNSAKSKWVNEEIIQFKKLHGEERILPIIVEGEPNVDLKANWYGAEECFAPALKFKLNEEGILSEVRTEPLCGDARKGKDGRKNALLKLISGILHVPFNILKNREQGKIRKQIISILSVSIILVGVFALISTRAIIYSKEASRASKESQQRLALNFFEKACNLVETGNYTEAIPYLTFAIRTDREKTAYQIKLEDIIRTKKFYGSKLSYDHSAGIQSATFSPDNTMLLTSCADGTSQLWDVLTGEKVGKQMKHAYNIAMSSFSLNGKLVATACSDGYARVWKVPSGEPQTDLIDHSASNKRDNNLVSISFSPSGDYIVTASWDGTANVWNALTGEPVGVPMKHTMLDGKNNPHKMKVSSAVFSPDGNYILTSSRNKRAEIWYAMTGVSTGKVFEHTLEVEDANYSPDGKYVVTASCDNTAQVWDVETGEAYSRPMRHNESVMKASFSLDGKLIATASLDNTARVWDAKTGNPVSKPLQHSYWVANASFSPDGKYVVTASWDNTAIIWDIQTGIPVSNPLKHNDDVNTAVFSKYGKYVLTASSDGTSKLWEIKTGRSIPQIYAHLNKYNEYSTSDELTAYNYSPDGEYILTSSMDGTVKTWDRKKTYPVAQTLKHPSTVWSTAVTPDSKHIITTSGDDNIRIWDQISSKEIKNIKSKADAVIISHNGKYLATASNNSVTIWKISTGQIVSGPFRHKNWIESMNFSPDDKMIVTASADSTARIWDINSSASSTSLKHSHWVAYAEFSPNSKYVVTASYDRTACIWDVKDNSLKSKLFHSGYVVSAKFSPDGKYIVTASHDNTAQVWNIETGASATQPMRHKGQVVWASFSPNGEFVATATADNKVQLWDALSGKQIIEPINHFCNKFSSVKFDPEGSQFITAVDFNAVQVCNVRLIPEYDEKFLLFCESLAGKSINNNGAMEDFDYESYKIPTKNNMLTWLNSEPTKRTISPESKITFNQYRRGVLDNFEETHWKVFEDLNDLAINDAVILAAYAIKLTYKKNVTLAELDKIKFLSELATKMDPENYEIWYFRSYFLQRIKDYDRSLKAIIRAIELNPDSYKSYLRKAYLYSYMSDYIEFKNMLSHSLELYKEKGEKENNDIQLKYLFEVQSLFKKYKFSTELEYVQKRIDKLST